MSAEVEIIRGARELLSDPKHWHQGGITSADGTAICAVHAISLTAVRLGHIDNRELLESTRRLIGAHVPSLNGLWQPGLSIYNDDPATTHQDILNIFDKTLADLGGLA